MRGSLRGPTEPSRYGRRLPGRVVAGKHRPSGSTEDAIDGDLQGDSIGALGAGAR